MKRHTNGFTLIELMITVAVVAILATVAYPRYTDSVMKSRRAEGKAKLMEAAQLQAQFFTMNNVYAANLAALYAGVPVMSRNNFYQITMVGGGNNYTLTATPQGSQANDTECANFTLNEIDVRGVSGSGTVPACW